MSTNAIPRAGCAVPLTKGGLGLLAPGNAPLSVDTSAMSATVVISHRSIDRTGDLVEPSGIDTANFARNPTVLLNHGKDYALPIGRAVDPRGNLTVKAEKDRVIATTYFAPTREGEQVFELVSQGFLNGASIGFSPLEERPIARGGHHYLRWELLEYSHVTTPACPNAAEVLRRCLSRGRVAGAPISEPLRKSLECMARPTAPVVRGGFDEGKHPRADDGKFGSGSGSGAGAGKPAGGEKPDAGGQGRRPRKIESEADLEVADQIIGRTEQAAKLGWNRLTPELTAHMKKIAAAPDGTAVVGFDSEKEEFRHGVLATGSYSRNPAKIQPRPTRGFVKWEGSKHLSPSPVNPMTLELASEAFPHGAKAMSKKWKKAPPATPAAETTAAAPATKAAPPPPPGKPAAQQQPDPAAQEQPQQPPAPAQTDLPTLLGQLTALIGQLTTIAQPAAPQAPAEAGMPPEGAGEQAEDEDAGFGGESEGDAEEDAANSGDGTSSEQEDDAEDEEETEELLQRYRAGEPAVTKDMTETDGQAGGYLADSLGDEHAKAIRAVADHLDEMAGCEPGSTFTHSHKAAFSHHAKAMAGVCRALDAGDAGEGDTPEASGGATEKGLDLDAASILDALKPLNEKVADFDAAIYQITGKKAS